MKKILVIGSANVDFVTYIDKMPKKGETKLGNAFLMNVGGKGANQAVACAKAGANVTFLAKIGQDENGKLIESVLRESKVKSKLLVDSDSHTGIATIIVENKTADNRIVVVKGANDKLTKNDIDNNIDLIKQCDILMVQLEIPLSVVKYVITLGHIMHKKIILNPAPAQKIDHKVLEYVTYLTPNKTELETLTKMSIADEDDLKIALDKISGFGVKNIIVTLGDKGSVLYKNKKLEYIPSYKVAATDTTGAGDCFNGVFAACLSKGYKAIDAIKYATKAASICITRNGAIKAMPNKKEIFE